MHGKVRLVDTKKTKKRHCQRSPDSSGCRVVIFGDLLHGYNSRFISTGTTVRHLVQCILGNLAATPPIRRFVAAAMDWQGVPLTK